MEITMEYFRSKHNLEKVIAYCKTTDETYEIADELETLVLGKLTNLVAAIAKAKPS